MTSPRIAIPRFCFCLWVNGIHRKFALIATIKPYGLSLGKSGKLEKKKRENKEMGLITLRGSRIDLYISQRMGENTITIQNNNYLNKKLKYFQNS